MSYTAPTSRSTGDVITAAIWNSDVVGDITFLANPPTCAVYNSAAISIPNAALTVVTFNSERFDTDTMHSTVSNTDRLTATTAGKYRIEANLSFALSAAGAVRQARLRINGVTEIAYHSHQPSGSHGSDMTIARKYQLAAGDYVQLLVYQDSGGALNLASATNYSPEFGMTWEGQ